MRNEYPGLYHDVLDHRYQRSVLRFLQSDCCGAIMRLVRCDLPWSTSLHWRVHLVRDEEVWRQVDAEQASFVVAKVANA